MILNSLKSFSTLTRKRMMATMLILAVSTLCLSSVFLVKSSGARIELFTRSSSKTDFFSLPSDKVLNRTDFVCNSSWMFEEIPKCSFCDTEDKNLTIFVENFEELESYYTDYEYMKRNVEKLCPLPEGAKCFIDADNSSSLTADAVFRMTKYVSLMRPVRYCYPQIFALLHSEAVQPGYDQGFMEFADIRVSYHRSSTVLFHDTCNPGRFKLNVAKKVKRKPSKRKGIAMFVSNCDAWWRYDYLSELMDKVHIDSYGSCLHNTDKDSDNMWTNPKNWQRSQIRTSLKYRMVVSFENTIQKDYISEKIFSIYQSGAIPVYWGPPDIYNWVPGNHTFIDASKYSGPKELAAYLKRVNEDDHLFRYHTTNFDWEKLSSMLKLCSPVNYLCGVCRTAYRLRELSRTQRTSPCGCDYAPFQ